MALIAVHTSVISVVRVCYYRWSPTGLKPNADSVEMSTTASPSIISTHHSTYSAKSPAISNSRAAATRLDDAINQLRSLKHNNGKRNNFFFIL